MRSKDSIIADIHGSFSGVHFTLMGELLSCLRAENRYDNDVAKGDNVLLNQGAIRCCVDIAKNLGLNLDEIGE